MPRQPRKPARFVMINNGYDMHDNWMRAKVISSRMVGRLFDDGQDENLLVEIPGGERMWVAFWEEIKEKNND